MNYKTSVTFCMFPALVHLAGYLTDLDTKIEMTYGLHAFWLLKKHQR